MLAAAGRRLRLRCPSAGRRCSTTITSDEPAVLSETRVFTAEDVTAFARLTGDDNPLHADVSFASSERYGARVVHGMLYASMFGAIVGVRYPGSVYISQSLSFRRPVFLGDAVTATLTLRRSGGGGRLLDFETTAANQHGELVISGDARVLLPRAARRPRQAVADPDGISRPSG